MEHAEFTAVIPVFNGERFVARAIESVLSQTIRPEQIVVVDDGSTDNTAAVVMQYANDGLEYIYQDNGGSASARNAAIRAARGKYIGFLDADDEWKEHLVSDVKGIFEKHPNLAWAAVPYVRQFQNGDVEFVRSVSTDLSAGGLIEDYFDAQARYRFSFTSATIVKREVFSRIGDFDTSISQYGEDGDMWFRIALIHPQIGYADRVGSVYWRREGSLMDADPRDVEHQLMRIHKTESHALALGGAALKKSEPLLLDWVWGQMKEAAVQGDKTSLEHISRYYGRRFSIRRRLLLDAMRIFPFSNLWATVRKKKVSRNSRP